MATFAAMASDSTFQRLPGFRDFLPEELSLRTEIFEAWRRVSRRYGFQEYDGPPLEPLDLYTEKSGEEIVEQLYHFEDKGGRQVALRPEMTPSMARILGAHSRSMPKPIRWFSVPQLFRYERQQRGRLREHFQWNVDVVGEPHVGADAEVLAVAIDGLRELGLGAEDFRARISDRRLLAELLRVRGVPYEKVTRVFSVVDKMEREPRDRVEERLRDDVELPMDTVEGVLALFDEPSLERVLDEHRDHAEVAREAERIRECLDILGHLGFGEFVEVDLTIVRGLAYYTGIVFELFDREGELRAICGGGRFDRLLEKVGGGEALPAVGFGMGDVVLSELLREKGRGGEEEPGVDFYVVAITSGEKELALRVAQARRAFGRSVVYALGSDSVRKQFAHASAREAREVIVLGPDEVQRGRAVVRDMATGDEHEVDLTELLEGGGE
ncbi:MAG: histidine--tRNA ligase [bacterium]